MYVNNVRLYAKHLRRDLVDGAGLPKPAHTRLLLQGANGSGKSTILEAIVTLWDFFGEWITVGPGRQHSHRWRCFKHYFAESDFAAIELKDVLPDGRSLWLGMGKVDHWVDLKDQHVDADFAGLIRSKGSWEVQLPMGNWADFHNRSIVGAEPKANVVYFPAEDRTVALDGASVPHLVDQMRYRWVAKFDANIDLASLLLTVRAESHSQYDAAITLINQALDNQRKEIVGLGPRGLIVHGKSESGAEYEHPIAQLSSGEKQMLLLIGFIAGTLRPGGIVVIDEPDLHIHQVMVQQLLGSIESIVKERHGQLIVAAHSQEVWNWFSLSSERVELAPWRGDAL